MTDREKVGIAMLAQSRAERLRHAADSLNRESRLCGELFTFELRAAGGAVTIGRLKPRKLVRDAKGAGRAFERDFDPCKCALPIGDNFLGGIDVSHARAKRLGDAATGARKGKRVLLWSEMPADLRAGAIEKLRRLAKAKAEYDGTILPYGWPERIAPLLRYKLSPGRTDIWDCNPTQKDRKLGYSIWTLPVPPLG